MATKDPVLDGDSGLVARTKINDGMAGEAFNISEVGSFHRITFNPTDKWMLIISNLSMFFLEIPFPDSLTDFTGVDFTFVATLEVRPANGVGGDPKHSFTMKISADLSGTGGQRETKFSIEGFVDSDKTNIAATATTLPASQPATAYKIQIGASGSGLAECVVLLTSVEYFQNSNSSTPINPNSAEIQAALIGITNAGFQVNLPIQYLNNGYMGHGTTANRPVDSIGEGARYYDTDLGSYITHDGSDWVEPASGAAPAFIKLENGTLRSRLIFNPTEIWAFDGNGISMVFIEIPFPDNLSAFTAVDMTFILVFEITSSKENLIDTNCTVTVRGDMDGTGGQGETQFSVEGFVHSDEGKLAITAASIPASQGSTLMYQLQVGGSFEGLDGSMISITSLEYFSTDNVAFDDVKVAAQAAKINVKNAGFFSDLAVQYLNFGYMGHGTTANRPTTSRGVGARYFDTTLDQWITWNGTNWIAPTESTV